MNKVDALLMDMGLSPDHVGFDYLSEAIQICVTDQSKIKKVCIGVYQAIADKHESATPSKVERNIRHAIGIIVTNASEELLDKYYINQTSAKNGAPRNGQFIACVSRVLQGERQQINS